MKISEAIRALSNIQRESGDLELVGMQEVDGQQVFDYNRTFEVIDVPFVRADGKKSLPAWQRVCALREEVDDDGFTGAA